VVTTATEEFLSPEEVGDRLGVSVYTVRRWVKTGQLRAFKPGKEYRIREADLEEFIQAREVRPKARSRSPLELTLNGLLEEDRRTTYLQAAIETVRGKAKAARWALEDVPSFAEAQGGYRPEQMLDGWSHFLFDMRSDADFLGRIWGEVIESVSGQATPADEEALVDELQGELRGFDDTVERLSQKFYAEFEGFRRQRRDAELAPNVHELMPREQRSQADDTNRSSEAG
jgi:excisionase family DNA binding protein